MVKRYSKKGVALFISIMLLFLLTISVAVILLTSGNYVVYTEEQIERLHAVTLAEAGVHYAYWKLRDVPGFTGVLSINPDDSGTNVDITVSLESGSSPPRYKVQSTVSY